MGPRFGIRPRIRARRGDRPPRRQIRQHSDRRSPRRPQLADFGLAKQLDDTSSLQTVDGSEWARPPTWPRNNARRDFFDWPRQRPGTASESCSMSCCRGARPFTGPPHEVLMAVAGHQEPPPLQSISPTWPPDLAAIGMKAIAKRIEDRYATAAEFGEDLLRWLRGESVKCVRLVERRALFGLARRKPRPRWVSWSSYSRLFCSLPRLGCGVPEATWPAH